MIFLQIKIGKANMKSLHIKEINHHEKTIKVLEEIIKEWREKDPNKTWFNKNLALEAIDLVDEWKEQNETNN